MSAQPIVIALICRWCSRQLPPFRTHRLGSNQVICDDCLDGHNHALEVLAGGIPKECQRCRTAWQVLKDISPGLAVRMYVVPKDGILQVLCLVCKEAYVRKRADLYKQTRFGNELNL